ncbi:VOC family protein [Microbacterium koreense]|uniref:VOC family protein n=1 Tax=Microbacterium koreense TaxID=323761 RepID=A0ABW2ZP83_9MICO
MFATADVFSGFSVDDIDAARSFYRDTLGLDVDDNEMGFLHLRLASGAVVMIYPKDAHEPASFTILNFAVADVEAAVDELRSRGVETKIYPDADFPSDEKGIVRGAGGGPDIAWFRDPAGNVLAVMQTA